MAALTEAQSDARQVPRPLYTPGTNDLLYVGNQGNNSITVYKHNVSGNTAPIKVIAGSKTGIASPGELSEDASGNLYVANGSPSNASTSPGILIFAHGANGNVAPIRRLKPAAGLINIEALTVDQSTEKLFVFEDAGPGNGDINDVTVLRYPPSATSSTQPFARAVFDYPSFPAIELASDSTGNN